MCVRAGSSWDLHVGGGSGDKCLHSGSVLKVLQVGFADSLDVGIREKL